MNAESVDRGPEVSGGREAHPEESKLEPSLDLIGEVALCLDGSATGESSLAHAVVAADAFHARLSLLHVLETTHDADTGPADPVQWEMARVEAEAYLNTAAERARAVSGGGLTRGVRPALLEGDPTLQIGRWVHDHGVDLVVFCTHGAKGRTHWPLASTARKLLDALNCSLLVVPASEGEEEPAVTGYARLLVPLDGSTWSESVLPLAIRLARAQGADLVLAHAVPCPELTRVGAVPPSPEDLELERRLVERNTSVGRDYLHRVHARLGAAGVDVTTIVECEGGALAGLAHAVAREHPDLIALSVCGRSGRTDRSCGMVAMHLLEHLRTPLLLLRPSYVGEQPPAKPRSAALRMPAQAGP